MIHKAKFENFKGLKDVEVTFDSRFTVLVGPNGTGKTSVLEGIHALLTSADRGSVASPFDLTFVGDHLDDWHTRGSPDTLGVEVELDTPSAKPFVIRISGTRTSGPIRPPEQRWSTKRQYRRVSRQGSQQFLDLSTVDAVSELGAIWPDSVLLHLDPRAMAESSSPPADPFVSPFLTLGNGMGLASYLAGIALADRPRYDKLIDAYRRVIPAVADVRFRRVQVTRSQPTSVTINGQPVLHNQTVQTAGEQLVFDFLNARDIPASSVSEGTLLSLGILAATHAHPGGPAVILLDDLEHGLHPKAQYELLDVLRLVIDETSFLQIIATSHSPYILDKLEPNEVRVTGLGEDGSVVIAPLTDHPAYEKWKDSMTPGEFWSHTGEDWLKKIKRETVSP